MDKKGTPPSPNIYTWVSFCLLAGFAYYWLFTFSMVFLNRPTRAMAPRQSMIYSSFFNQNWRLFASTKKYSCEVNLVLKRKADSVVTDSIALVSYSMAQRRKKAPFNNYSEALERLLYVISTHIGESAKRKKEVFKKQVPLQNERFYVQETSLNLEKDSLHRANLKNLENYAKYVLAQEQVDTAGKEFQLILVRNYIKPALTPVITGANTNSEIIFVSTFKPL
jgi:hypothetical protein